MCLCARGITASERFGKSLSLCTHWPQKTGPLVFPKPGKGHHPSCSRIPHLPTARGRTYASHPPSPASSQLKLLADRDMEGRPDSSSPGFSLIFCHLPPPLVSCLLSLLSLVISLSFPNLRSPLPALSTSPIGTPGHESLPFTSNFASDSYMSPSIASTNPTRTLAITPASTMSESESESTATIRTRTTKTSREIITVTVSTVTTPIAKTTTIATTTMAATPAPPASGDAADMPGPSNGTTRPGITNGTPGPGITNGTSASALAGRSSMPTLSTRTSASLLPDKDSISALYARNSMPSLGNRSPGQ